MLSETNSSGANGLITMSSVASSGTGKPSKRSPLRSIGQHCILYSCIYVLFRVHLGASQAITTHSRSIIEDLFDSFSWMH